MGMEDLKKKIYIKNDLKNKYIYDLKTVKNDNNKYKTEFDILKEK